MQQMHTHDASLHVGVLQTPGLLEHALIVLITSKNDCKGWLVYHLQHKPTGSTNQRTPLSAPCNELTAAYPFTALAVPAAVWRSRS